jgi:hypothetical protein
LILGAYIRYFLNTGLIQYPNWAPGETFRRLYSTYVWKEADEAIDVSLALGRRPIDLVGLRRGRDASAAAHRN